MKNMLKYINDIKIMSIIWTIGAFLVSLTYLLLHIDLVFYDIIFWAGILLSGLSTYAIISSDNKTNVKLLFLFLFGFILYIPRVLSSPDHFHTYDDLIHYQTTLIAYDSGNIDTQFTGFEISKYYPALEILTVFFKNLSGGTIFSSGLIIIGIAHSFTIIFLYLFFRNIFSEKIGLIGTFAYFFNSSYTQFDTYFSYESIGLPLLTACLFVASLNNDRVNNIKVTIVQIVLIIGIVITHHFSSYMFLLFMTILLAIKFINHSDYKRVSRITIFTFTVIFAWVLYIATITMSYFGDIFTNSLKGVLTLSLFKERFSEILSNQFLDIPYYELFIRRFIYIPLITILVIGGIYYLYSKKKYSEYSLTLTLFCGLFFISIIGTLTSSFGIERFFTYGFIGIAFLIGVSIENIEKIQKLSILPIIIVLLLLIAGISIGISSPFRGSYSMNSRIGQETITADLISSAEWSGQYLKNNETYLSDIVTSSAFEHFGLRKVNTYAGWEAFFPSEVNSTVIDHLKIYVIDYVVVDNRITKYNSELYYYFGNEELYMKDHPPYGRTEPMPKSSIQKFDNDKIFYKIYDNGDINIFKVVF